MTGFEAKCKLHELKVVAGMNYRYHKALEQRYGWRDRIIRIAVGVVAISSLLFAVLELHALDVIVAILALAIAYVLNVFQFVEWSKEHGESFRLWHAHQIEIERAAAKTDDIEDESPVENSLVAIIRDLSEDSLRLDSEERPYLEKDLLDSCLGDEIESIYGKGARTYEEAMNRREEVIREQFTSAA